MIKTTINTNSSAQIKTKRYFSESFKESFVGYLYVSPFFILFGIFGLFPILFSFYLGFQKWNGLNEMEFVGLNNYKLIYSDPVFWKAIYNTIIIGFLGCFPILVFSIILAFILNSAFVRLKSIFRVSLFMPYVTSTVAVAIVFGVIFSNMEFGIANLTFSWFGFEPIKWQVGEWAVKIAIACMVLWRWVGYNVIIFIAGLQSIPIELYEAATIDGATTRQQLFYITVPLLKPVIIFTVFLSTVGSLQLFTEPLIFLGRNAREEGITAVLYLWREAFNNMAFGTASAAAVTLFFIIIIVSFINYLITNRISS
ncbi:sugar ABC transporter permease [Aquibacillus albus]|uniref:Cellobiose transport system permease protein n=1 Tax=Aquibacillus albus TaxID=1168171 RepID=A0ABS2MW93_9BACI|nr:cellobiose transport system permease protein [Aquibacillus albus]